MLSLKEEWRDLLISVIVVSGAFTIQNITLSFFIPCFSIVLLSYLAHEIAHEKTSDYEGMESKSELSGIGIIITLASGILTQGLAVLALPLITKTRNTETERWMMKADTENDRELGLISTSGSLVNLVIGTVFLGLYSFTGTWTFWLVSLINFWLGISNMTPIHPFDGGNTLMWSEWLWLTIMVAGSTGLLGLFILI